MEKKRTRNVCFCVNKRRKGKGSNLGVGFNSASQGLMVVEEAFLMGDIFQDKNECLITRFTQNDAAAAAAAQVNSSVMGVGPGGPGSVGSSRGNDLQQHMGGDGGGMRLVRGGPGGMGSDGGNIGSMRKDVPGGPMGPGDPLMKQLFPLPGTGADSSVPDTPTGGSSSDGVSQSSSIQYINI